VEVKLFCGSKHGGKSTIKAIVNEFEYKGNIKLDTMFNWVICSKSAEYLDGEITLLKPWKMPLQ
jgi:uncharacterized Fe-S cluster protein YjdI